MKRVPLFVGDCNLCGLCCFNQATGSHCENLVLRPGKTVGDPDATYCGVYDQRYHGMPITMIDKDGNRVDEGQMCAKDSVEEDLQILVSGMGRGCSLMFNPEVTTVFVDGKEKSD